MGRVLLAALPEEAARALLDRSDLSPRTAFSLTDPEEIMAELARVRAQGYCLIDQEVEIGLRSIAVPLTDIRGRVVAALNTGVAATQDSVVTLVEKYLPAMQRTQSGIGRVLS